MTDRALARLQAVVAAAGILTAGIGGAFALGVLGAPTVVGVENRFGPVNDDVTYVLTDLVVHNPNPIGVRLGETTVNYTVEMNDIAMAGGTKTGLQVDRGNTTLVFNSSMRNSRIPPWWVSHIKNGERTNVTIDANIQTSILGNRTFEVKQDRTVKTNLIGQFNSNETRPVDGPPSPAYDNPILYINETSAQWGTVTQAETPIDMAFVVFNPQLKPYTITEVGYVVSMNNVTVAEGTTKQPYIIEGQTTETVQTTARIDNSKLDDWWVTHIEANQVTHLRIDFYAKVELPTGNTIRLPLNELTYEHRIETDIFGTKGEPRNDTDGDGASPTTTEKDTEGGTASATASPTPSPTPTDDGSVLNLPLMSRVG